MPTFVRTDKCDISAMAVKAKTKQRACTSARTI